MYFLLKKVEEYYNRLIDNFLYVVGGGVLHEADGKVP
jgi:hypothetical protein